MSNENANDVLRLDLRDQNIESLDDFWDLIQSPLELPEWFGRNLNAWDDTLNAGDISPLLDSHKLIEVHVRRLGIFAEGNPDGEALAKVFEDGNKGRLVVA